MLDRRAFLDGTRMGLGALALHWLWHRDARVLGEASSKRVARAKRVIFLQQSGAPSQLDLFDPKPHLAGRHGSELPESVRQGQRLTTMTAEQARKPIAASPFDFQPSGESGIEISELLPCTAQVVDHLCVVRSMHTEAINHDPAMTLLQTGVQQPGRPSMGAWVHYGLGSQNDSLPAFLVLISGGDPGDQPLFQRLWGSGFLPGRYQGVRLRSGRDPVLYLANPSGISATDRRRTLDTLDQLNQAQQLRTGDPELASRIAQFELAYRMQTAVPELFDLSHEPAHTWELYGDAAKTPGSFAANCLLARRLVERGVRFVQLYHRDWDHHTSIENRLRKKCLETDQASAALVHDLRQRGLLDDTLVIWGGEFGRTVYCQGELDSSDYGRDHHPRCFSIWLAGGGTRGGFVHGKTDDYSYNVVEQPVSIHDLQATMLYLLGLDHEQLTFRFAGRDHRLTDVSGRVVREWLS
jgi:uncharacterized protein (DUF1501 family)